MPLESPDWWDLQQRYERKLPSLEEIICAMVAGILQDYASHKENYSLAIMYEDVKSNPEQICR